MMPGFLLQDQQPNIEEVDQASVRKAMGHHVVWKCLPVLLIVKQPSSMWQLMSVCISDSIIMSHICTESNLCNNMI